MSSSENKNGTLLGAQLATTRPAQVATRVVITTNQPDANQEEKVSDVGR
jgi:hypothetical protein